MNIVARTQINATALHKSVKGLGIDELLPDSHRYLSIIFPPSNSLIQELMVCGFGQLMPFHGKFLLTINLRDLQLLKNATEDDDVKAFLEWVK